MEVGIGHGRDRGAPRTVNWTTPYRYLGCNISHNLAPPTTGAHYERLLNAGMFQYFTRNSLNQGTAVGMQLQLLKITSLSCTEFLTTAAPPG